MKTKRYSYIKKLLGEYTYEEFKRYARNIVPIGTIVLVILFTLSLFVHLGVINYLLNLVLGTSLIFIAYVLGVILLLDYEVDIEMEENWDGSLTMPNELPINFKRSKVIDILLIIIGVAVIYFSNKYRKHYDFECETFLVDETRGIYHLYDGNDDEDVSYTTKMKGYELEEHEYTFCEDCKEWLEDMEMSAEAERYYRR